MITLFTIWTGLIVAGTAIVAAFAIVLCFLCIYLNGMDAFSNSRTHFVLSWIIAAICFLTAWSLIRYIWQTLIA